MQLFDAIENCFPAMEKQVSIASKRCIRFASLFKIILDNTILHDYTI